MKAKNKSIQSIEYTILISVLRNNVGSAKKFSKETSILSENNIQSCQRIYILKLVL